MAVLSGATASGRQFYYGQLGTTASVLYTAKGYTTNVTSDSGATSGTTGVGPATAYIKEIFIGNTGVSAVTVTLYLVPSGGTANSNTSILYQVSVNPNDSKILAGLNTMLAAGMTIQGLASSATTVTVSISGVEVQ